MRPSPAPTAGSCANLTRDAFSILDNGRRQDLTLFSSDLQPITVVMLLDRSGSMRGNFALVQKAAEEFVEVMRADDKARIGSFSNGIQVDPRDFTSDHDELLHILRTELQAEGPDAALERGQRGHHGAAAPAGPPRGAGVHRRHGQPDESHQQQQQLAQGRDEARRGRGRHGVRDRARAVDAGSSGGYGRHGGGGFHGAAVAADFGRGGFGRGWRRLPAAAAAPAADHPDEGLAKIAGVTGGGYFELTSTSDLAATFSRVADELHRQYALGFTPDKLDGKMHTIEVRVAGDGMTARARRSYLARAAAGSS